MCSASPLFTESTILRVGGPGSSSVDCSNRVESVTSLGRVLRARTNKT